ncbi:MAG: NIL domain-containing protein [Actinomycetota bacterium]|nr:NIL domain-containing protein [Actinomycetota bacterium]MDD5666455.1 NIL domain-containing protein [Actinomycetota bacterium]
MVRHKIVLHFPHEQVDKPIVSRLVRDFGLDFNILKASITPREEGLLVLEIIGKEKDYERGMAYIESCGVSIQPLSQDIRRNDAKCTHCGACIAVCPTDALRVDRDKMEVAFNDEECVACELCIKVCPPRAMEIHY